MRFLAVIPNENTFAFAEIGLRDGGFAGLRSTVAF
jgi:hypothetical protein